MSDEPVRRQLERYVEDVTPVQLPPFAEVAERRRRRRLTRALAGTTTGALVLAIVVVAAVSGGGHAGVTAAPSTTPAPQPLDTADALKKALVGTSWRLVAVDGVDTYWREGPDSLASVGFDAGDFDASDGCDSVRSAVTYGDKGVLTFDADSGSRGECAMAASDDKPGTQPPREFMATLNGEVTAAAAGNLLTLTQGTTVLTLKGDSGPYLAANAATRLQALLTSHTWPLRRITSGGKTWGDPRKAVLQFGADGYQIDPDCNDHSGKISYAAGSLFMQAFQTTAVGCSSAAVAEARSADALDGLFSGPVSVEEDSGLLMLWNDKTYVELHQGPAPAHELVLGFPPPSGAPSGQSSGATRATTVEQQLVGTRWMLRSITVSGKPVPRAGDVGASITFGAESYLLDDGCNGIDGSIGYLDGSVLMTEGSSTAMYCPPIHLVTDAERFAGTFSVGLDGTVLTLTSPDRTYVFDAGTPKHQPLPTATSTLTPTATGAAGLLGQLAGAHWLPESWTDHDAQGQGDAGPQGPYVSFAPSGVVAFDGCNTHSGPATYAGTAVTVGSMGSSTAACAQPAQQVQQAYLDLFAHPVSVYVFGDGQRLTLSGGNVSLSLHRDTGVPPASAAVALVGPEWKLRSVEGPDVHWQARPTTTATMGLTASTYNVSDGCESHQGDLAFDSAGTTLTLVAPWAIGACSMSSPGPPAGTFPPPDYLAAFQGKATAALAGSTLTVTSGKDVLTFSR